LNNKDANNTANDFWYPLDNAAKIYPAIKSKELTIVFRISAVLKERVKIIHLQNAIQKIDKRFPYFKVRLRKGFFWYYLEYADLPVIVEPDNKAPCREFNDKNSLLFRILVFRNRISVEFSHILTDGTGALNFFRALLIEYFKQDGCVVSNELDYHRPDIIFSEEEFEDSYNRYFQKNIPPNIKKPKAFHLPFSIAKKPVFDVLIAIMYVNELKEKAKFYKISVTEYLISVYLFVLQDIYRSSGRHRRKNKFIRIQVPLNLRNIYPSKTMRNFSLFVMPEIDLRLGEYEFDEIVKTVHYTMKLETDRKLINKIISRNVGSEKKLFVRGIPLFIKSLILKLKYYSMGINQYSGVITNIGLVEFSKEIDERMEYFLFTPPPPAQKLKVNCGVIGFNDILTISFGNVSASKELERRFIKFLVDQKIKIRLLKY
jgi:NRPS condensation-like uncharacterized protein